MARDKDIKRFKRDVKEFGLSAAGHIPGIGRVLGVRDMYQKGKKLKKSTRPALNTLKRRAKSKINRRLRRYL